MHWSSVSYSKTLKANHPEWIFQELQAVQYGWRGVCMYVCVCVRVCVCCRGPEGTQLRERQRSDHHEPCVLVTLRNLSFILRAVMESFNQKSKMIRMSQKHCLASVGRMNQKG